MEGMEDSERSPRCFSLHFAMRFSFRSSDEIDQPTIEVKSPTAIDAKSMSGSAKTQSAKYTATPTKPCVAAHANNMPAPDTSQPMPYSARTNAIIAPTPSTIQNIVSSMSCTELGSFVLTVYQGTIVVEDRGIHGPR